MSESTSKEFDRIYHSGVWASRSRSGPGSLPELNESYLCILRSTIAEQNIKSVVDIGCGDWTLYQSAFDWHDLDVTYTGIDVVPELIEKLTNTYGRKEVAFRCLDVFGGDLPSADLFILKDILQHWPNERVTKFLPQLQRCRFALITNDLDIQAPGRSWFRKIIRCPFKNADIPIGGYRPLRLRDAPFNLPADLLLNYSVKWEGWSFDKETLLYRNKPMA